MRTAAEIACSINGPKSILDATIAESKILETFPQQTLIFEKSIHGAIIAEAWDEANKTSTKYTDELKKAIGFALRVSVQGPDGKINSISGKDYHFDERFEFSDILDEWIKVEDFMNTAILYEDKKNILNIILENKKDLLQIRSDLRYDSPLGFRMHTLQDFYAHSNYVELYVAYYKYILNGNMADLTPQMIPTFLDARDKLENEGFFKFIGQKGYLFTGEFNTIPDGIKIILKKLKVTDQLYRETTKLPHHHNGLSKDSPDANESFIGSKIVPGLTTTKWFDLAKNVALRHCITIFKKRLQ